MGALMLLKVIKGKGDAGTGGGLHLFFYINGHNIGIQNGDRNIFVGLTSHFLDVYETKAVTVVDPANNTDEFRISRQ